MKNILLSFILILNFFGIAQAQYQEITEYPMTEDIYPEENYEAEMYLQNDDDVVYPSPFEVEEDYLIQEEVYDDQAEYYE